MRLISLLLLITIISCNRKPSNNFSGDLEIGIEQSDSLKLQEVKSYLLNLDSGIFFFQIIFKKGIYDPVGIIA